MRRAINEVERPVQPIRLAQENCLRRLGVSAAQVVVDKAAPVEFKRSHHKGALGTVRLISQETLYPRKPALSANDGPHQTWTIPDNGNSDRGHDDPKQPHRGSIPVASPSTKARPIQKCRRPFSIQAAP